MTYLLKFNNSYLECDTAEKINEQVMILHIENTKYSTLVLTRTVNEPYGLRVLVDPQIVLQENENPLTCGDKVRLRGKNTIVQKTPEKSKELELEI